MLYTIWLLIGILLALLFLLLARSRGTKSEPTVLAIGLLVAAIIYIGFALRWGNTQWIAIEVGGLLLYALFVLLAQRHNLIWLAIGLSSLIGWGLPASSCSQRSSTKLKLMVSW